MLTWMVNNDREFLQGGATGATKPGVNTFPYLASPNTEMQTVVDSVELAASPDKVWALIGRFGGTWHPLIANIKTVTGTGIGQLRTIETIDGKQIIERLEASRQFARDLSLRNDQRHSAIDYTGTLSVKPKGTGSSVEWRVQYLGGWPTRHCHKNDRFHSAENGSRKPESSLRCRQMIAAPEHLLDYPLVTDGDIAVINLASARQQSWSRFWQDPQRPGIAEYIVEQEQLTAQYLGDLTALDRLETLVNQLDRVSADSMRTALIHAQVAAMAHRFAEARGHLTQPRPAALCRPTSSASD